MGICASCLGRTRQDENAESSRLLFEDPYQNYGAFQSHAIHQNVHQPHPEDLKREQEALDAICQRTSDAVVDIWAFQPHPPSSLDHQSTNGHPTGLQKEDLEPRLLKPHSKQSLRSQQFSDLSRYQQIGLFNDLEIELDLEN